MMGVHRIMRITRIQINPKKSEKNSDRTTDPISINVQFVRVQKAYLVTCIESQNYVHGMLK